MDVGRGMLRVRSPSAAAKRRFEPILPEFRHGTRLAERHAMSAIYHTSPNSSDKQLHLAHRATTGLLATGLITSLLFALTSLPVHSQVILKEMPVTFTVEGYGNATAAATREAASVRGQGPDSVLFDGAARVLARLTIFNGPDIGARVVVEGSTDHVHLSEVSALLFGSAGRLEVGKRMGLPDVLTGYAPNSFAFTTAEFGPPTGRSLDPGGGLQTQFLQGALRSRLEPLAARGVTASLFNDESLKVLYVLPKHNGWLGGVSFAADAEDPRFDRLAQIGLVHETYWHQDVWRWGGTYAHARADRAGDGAILRDLNSVSLGTSVVLNDSLDIGFAASYDGTSGTSRLALGNSASPALGATGSLNYNAGPWTVGGYYQYARAQVAGSGIGNARLSAFEVGASYRFTTRLRFYGAWFLYELANDGVDANAVSGGGSVFTLGLRATL